MGTPRLELAGKTINNFTVLHFTAVRNHRTHWLCRCVCGNEFEGAGVYLHQKQSCGCLRRQKSAKQLGDMTRTHGLSKTPIYRKYRNIVRRCTNPSDKDYKNYGARGITVDPRWDTFEKFFADVGHPPAPGMSIDRINNNGPYSPDNFRWVNSFVQAANRRTNLKVTFKGETLTISEWARRYNIKRQLLRNRYVDLKWDFEEALTRCLCDHTKFKPLNKSKHTIKQEEEKFS
jgi:hypothetical protein